MLPPDSLFYLTDLVTEYVKQRFWWNITDFMRWNPGPSDPNRATPSIFSQTNAGPTPPETMKPHPVNECEHMAAIAAQAFMTHGTDKFLENGQKFLMIKSFSQDRELWCPAVQKLHIEETIRTNRKGRGQVQRTISYVQSQIIAHSTQYYHQLFWTDSHMVSPGCTVSIPEGNVISSLIYEWLFNVLHQLLIWKAALKIDPAFSGTISYPTKVKMKSWQSYVNHYKPATNTQPKPGNVNFSPAWFQQGSYVRLTPFHYYVLC